MTRQSSTTPGLLSSYLQSITNQYSDVTLECEGHKFFCHKVILAAQSKFFSSLFRDVFGGGDKTSQQVFQLPGVTKTGMEQAINFIYCRPMYLTMSTIWVVVKEADFLLLDEVADECSRFILNNLMTSNCLSVLGMAEKFHLARLSDQVEEFILHNLWQIGGTEEFLDIESSSLVRFLQDDRLVVKMEEDVWRLIMSWMQGSGDRRKEVEKIIMPTIRFGLMDRDYFLQNVASHPFTISNPLMQEVTQYLAVLENPTTSMVNLLTDKYGHSTPKFAMPRLPSRLLLQVGGFTSSPSVAMVMYDVKTERWTEMELQLPEGLAYPSAEVVKEKIVLTGGVSQHPGNPPVYSRNTWIIDLKKMVVEKGPQMKLRRNFVMTAVVGETVYAIGGRSSAGTRRLSDCEKLELSDRKQPLNWERIQPVRPGRSDAGAVGVGDRVWLVGGFDGENCLNSVMVLNTVTGRWRRGPDMQIARSGLGCEYLDGWVYAVGGMDGVSRLRSVERIRPGDTTWERVEDMTSPRSNFSLGILEGRLVAAGGFNGVSVTDQVETFDPETGVWEKGESMVEAKSGMASVVVDRGIVAEEVQEAVFGMRMGLMEKTIERRRREMEMCLEEECDCSEEEDEELDSREFDGASFIDDEDENQSDIDIEDD